MKPALIYLAIGILLAYFMATGFHHYNEKISLTHRIEDVKKISHAYLSLKASYQSNSITLRDVDVELKREGAMLHQPVFGGSVAYRLLLDGSNGSSMFAIEETDSNHKEYRIFSLTDGSIALEPYMPANTRGGP